MRHPQILPLPSFRFWLNLKARISEACFATHKIQKHISLANLGWEIQDSKSEKGIKRQALVSDSRDFTIPKPEGNA